MNCVEIYNNLYLCEFNSRHEANQIVSRIVLNADKNAMPSDCEYYSWLILGREIQDFLNKQVIYREKEFIGLIQNLIGNQKLIQCYFIIIANRKIEPEFENSLNHELSHYLYLINFKYRIHALWLCCKNIKQLKKIWIQSELQSYKKNILNELIAFCTILDDFKLLEYSFLDQYKIKIKDDMESLVW